MTKREIYYHLQLVVMKDTDLTYEDTLEVLRELMTQEDLAKFAEEQEAKQQEAVEG